MTSNLPLSLTEWNQIQGVREEAVHGGKEGVLANGIVQLGRIVSMKGASWMLLQLRFHAKHSQEGPLVPHRFQDAVILATRLHGVVLHQGLIC